MGSFRKAHRGDSREDRKWGESHLDDLGEEQSAPRKGVRDLTKETSKRSLGMSGPRALPRAKVALRDLQSPKSRSQLPRDRSLGWTWAIVVILASGRGLVGHTVAIGCFTRGPPDSAHRIDNRGSSPAFVTRHFTSTRPLRADSAPYLTAFVASSCTAIARVRVVLCVSATSFPPTTMLCFSAP
jgi:hypothetical protein